MISKRIIQKYKNGTFHDPVASKCLTLEGIWELYDNEGEFVSIVNHDGTDVTNATLLRAFTKVLGSKLDKPGGNKVIRQLHTTWSILKETE